MFGAGMPPEPVKDPQALRRELMAFGEEMNRLSTQLENAKAAVDNSSDKFAEARESAAETRNEAIQTGAKVNSASGLWDSVRAAGETMDSFEQNMRDERTRLDPERAEVQESFKLARFFKDFFEKEFSNAIIKGQLEAVLENQLAGLDIAVFALGRAIKDAGAISTGRASSGMELSKHTYLRVTDPLKDESIARFEQALAQQRSLNSKERALAEREASGRAHYGKMLAKKKDELAAAERELRQAETRRDSASAEVERMKIARDQARDRVAALMDRMRSRQEEGRRVGQAYEDSMARGEQGPTGEGQQRISEENEKLRRLLEDLRHGYEGGQGNPAARAVRPLLQAPEVLGGRDGPYRMDQE